MEQNYLISIIVPVYNTGALLPRCIQSIQAQTYRNLEILPLDEELKYKVTALQD